MNPQARKIPCNKPCPTLQFHALALTLLDNARSTQNRRSIALPVARIRQEQLVPRHNLRSAYRALLKELSALDTKQVTALKAEQPACERGTEQRSNLVFAELSRQTVHSHFACAAAVASALAAAVAAATMRISFS